MINTSSWREFTLDDLFDIKSPSARSEKSYEAGEVDYVSSGAFNNGIANHLQPKDGEELDKGHCITVSPLDGSSFWQEEDFMGRGGSGASISMLYNDNLNNLRALFICSVIRNTARKFGYSDLLNSKNLRTLNLKLPATSDGQPDWDYMESYMKAVMEVSEKSLDNLKKVNNTKHQINVSGWQKFHLYDNCLFGIDMGTKLDKAKMTEINPVVNFVGRANANNGITARVDKVEGIKPYPEGYMTLSLGGEYLGSCFIQPKPFYTSQNVIVLIPNEHMTDNVKRFIATMIFRTSRSKYRAFIDELNRHIKTDFEIYLPIDANGEPDWQYMEDYMERRLNEAELAVSQLQLAV